MSTTWTVLLDSIEVSDLLIHLVLLLFIGILFSINSWQTKSIGVIYLVLASVMMMGKPTICTKGQVLASHMYYNEAIYLLLEGQGPKFCVLPWNEDAAKELQKLTQEGVPFYFDPSLEDPGEDVFHPMPQPGTPPKPEQPPVRSFEL